MNRPVLYQPSMLPPAREQVLVKSCLEYLNACGHFAWRQNQGSVTAEYKGKKRFVRFSGVAGISDIIGVLQDSGRLIAVECKVKPNKPTPSQLMFLDQVRINCGVAIVVYSMDDLIKVLGKEGEKAI